MKITKKVEFDAGHRIPSHNSKCRNCHGHRYVLECTLEGMIQSVRGESDDGMVLDFGDIKRTMLEEIADPWDHAFLVWEGDITMKEALKVLGEDHKTVELPVVPTAEELSAHAFNKLDGAFNKLYGDRLRLANVRIYETPNGWADTDG